MLLRQYLSEFDDTLSILNALHQSQTSLPVSFIEVLVSFKRCALLRYLHRLILASKPRRLPACHCVCVFVYFYSLWLLCSYVSVFSLFFCFYSFHHLGAIHCNILHVLLLRALNKPVNKSSAIWAAVILCMVVRSLVVSFPYTIVKLFLSYWCLFHIFAVHGNFVVTIVVVLIYRRPILLTVSSFHIGAYSTFCKN